MVGTGETIAGPTVVAAAFKGADSVSAHSVDITWNIEALVDVNAVDTVTRESDVARTFETTLSVGARCVCVTIVFTTAALVDVDTGVHAGDEVGLKLKAIFALTLVTWTGIGADGLVTGTLVVAVSTFINIGTDLTGTFV